MLKISEEGVYLKKSTKVTENRLFITTFAVLIF